MKPQFRAVTAPPLCQIRGGRASAFVVAQGHGCGGVEGHAFYGIDASWKPSKGPRVWVLCLDTLCPSEDSGSRYQARPATCLAK
jgi:hypothetical protein